MRPFLAVASANSKLGTRRRATAWSTPCGSSANNVRHRPGGRNVVVIGGGNSAIDAARTNPPGSRSVTVLYRRTRAVPAFAEEIEAEHERTDRDLVAHLKSCRRTARSPVSSAATWSGEFDRSGRRRPVDGKDEASSSRPT